MKNLLFAIVVIGSSVLGVAEELNLEKIIRPPVVGEELEPPILKQTLYFNQQNGRIFYIPLQLKGRGSLKIIITGGNDDSGDGGMSWRLMDSNMKKSYGGNMTKKIKEKSWVVKGIHSSNVILILEDKDTLFRGKNPGNRFQIAVKFP